MSDKKSVLILNQRGPYSSSAARDSLDVALTCSIFEMPVSLAFCGDGIYQLLKQQQPKLIGAKNLESMLSALPMYDIETIYVVAEDMQRNGFTQSDLVLPVTMIAQTELNTLIANHDTVLTF